MTPIPSPRQLDERLWELHGKCAEGIITAEEREELDGRCALNERRSAVLRTEPYGLRPDGPLPLSQGEEE